MHDVKSKRINNKFFVVLNLDGTLKTAAFKTWEKEESGLAKTCRREIRGCCAGEWRDTASVMHCPQS